MNPKLMTFLCWLVTLATPLALIGLALRLLLTPVFLKIEYRMPYFPRDEYGFTQEDRLRWSDYALNYLIKDVDQNYLAELEFENGDALFTDRELSHMVDVRAIVTTALKIWYVGIGAMLALVLWSARSGWRHEYLSALRRGGWLMVGLAALVGLLVFAGIAINPEIFWKFFSGFHRIFFEGDSWLFAYSDTLIRLFPIRFWQDAFLFAALISLGDGLLLGVGLKPK